MYAATVCSCATQFRCGERGRQFKGDFTKGCVPNGALYLTVICATEYVQYVVQVSSYRKNRKKNDAVRSLPFLCILPSARAAAGETFKILRQDALFTVEDLGPRVSIYFAS